MSETIFDKRPAFFRAMAAEMFFEAESADTDAIMKDLELDPAVDAELDAILG